MRRLKWAGLFLLVLGVLYGFAGFLLVPRLLRSSLPEKLSASLHRPVALREVRFNPFRLVLELRGLEIRELDGRTRFFSLGALYVDVSSGSLWKRGLVVEELRLTDPYVRVARAADGGYNFSDLLRSGPPEEKRKAGEGPKFAVGNVRLVRGALDFVDQVRGETHTVRDFSLTLPFASNFPAYVESSLQPALSGQADGCPFSLRGRAKAFAESLESSAEVRLSGLDLPRYARYLPPGWKARLRSGRLDAFLAASYVQRRQGGPSLSLSGTLDLKEAVVEDLGGRKVLALPLVSAGFGPVEVFTRSARVARLRVEAPELELVRTRAGGLNVEALLPPKKEEPEEKSPGFGFRVDVLSLDRGKLAFSDEGAGFRTVLGPIEVAVRGLSNAPGEKARASFSAASEAGESLALDAALGLEPVEAAGQLRLERVDLAKYAPYYRDKLRAEGAGRLGLETSFAFRAGAEAGPKWGLSGLRGRFQGLRVRQSGDKFELLSLAELALEGGEVDPGRRHAAVAQLIIANGNLSLRRGKEGRWNVQQLGAPAAGPAADLPAAKRKPEAGGEKPWAISVARLSTRSVNVAVEDQTTPQAARLALSRLSVDAAGLSTAPGKQGNLSVAFLLNRMGKVAAQGPLSLQPFSTRLRLELKGAEIAPFQPYFAQQLRALVTSGAVGADGILTVAAPEGKPLQAAFRGGAHVADFSCIHRSTDEDLLRFGALAVQGVDFRASPPEVKIQGVSLTDFATAATLNPDGSLNLSEAFAPPPPARPSPPGPRARSAAGAGPKPGPPTTVEVQTVTLQGGRVTFRDRQVTPAYTTQLAELGGRISGLSSQEGRLADVDLRGKVDGYAPLTITGQVQPLRQELFVDLKAVFQGADLTPATPYAGKYAGYAIEKGKLSFDLRYKIQGRKLESQNVLILDQFTFGERIESPDATKLPVRLGIALLKDRRGEIRLDLPVTGSLDDPEFRVGRIIWKMVVNLLTKAATSPFALLGSLFGGQDDLGYVEFEPGSSALNEPALGKVRVLSKALKERPGLRLEIAGGFEVERDRAPLQRAFLERKLKAQKAEELASEGVEPGPLEQLTLTPEERPRYVALAYRAEAFPKPSTAKGAEKELVPEEMEKLLLTHVQITDEDLRWLADERAGAVRDALLRSEGVETQRIFTTRASAREGERGSGPKLCRVDFRLTE